MKSLLLQGYGCSIKVKDTRLIFSQGTHAFSKEREIIETSVRACNFDKVVIQGDGYVSTKALQILAENNFESPCWISKASSSATLTRYLALNLS